MPLLVNQKELAKLLGRSVNTIWRWRVDGIIPAVCVSKKRKRFVYNVAAVYTALGIVDRQAKDKEAS